MNRLEKSARYIIIPLCLFLTAYLLRQYFFCGFILGDDAEELPLMMHLDKNGADFGDYGGHLQYRFNMWIYNVLFFKLMGISEISFFMPTILMSSTLAVVAYFLLLHWEYGVLQAALGGLLVASAPYEILIGTVRANDMILAWFMALGLLCFFLLERRPAVQGILTAFFAWMAFYTKLWVIYVFPAIGIYYLIQVHRKGVWRGLASFAAVTVFLHSLTCVFWKIKIGVFLPFLKKYSATYPVAARDLPVVLMHYPKMIFQGSEFGTTLFGSIPYLLLVLLLVKTILSVSGTLGQGRPRFDRVDKMLFVYYFSFFLFMNFFPANFKFDQYYSTPRIFRYLAPLSFPMTLHLAKLLMDLCHWMAARTPRPGKAALATTALFITMIFFNVVQADNATKPGQAHRDALKAVINDVREQSPPKFVAGCWLWGFFHDIYFADNRGIDMPLLSNVYSVRDNERWLLQNESSLPDGTLLLTGLSGYVHYGNHWDGFRLAQFEKPLNKGWELFRDYGTLTYLPIKEPVRLWRWSKAHAALSPDDLSAYRNNDPDALFKSGLHYVGLGDNAKARLFFEKIVREYPGTDKAAEAQFMYAVCYFSEGDWTRAIDEFNSLIKGYPKSTRIALANDLLKVSLSNLKNVK